MPVKIVWSGLEELKAALRKLPAHLTGEASHIVEGSANAAAVEANRGYGAHKRTGNMARKTAVTHRHDQFAAVSTVTNTDKNAVVFEIGSQVRHTSIGANRGSMPAAHVFVPAMQRQRKRMYQQLAALLTREGLEVSGG